MATVDEILSTMSEDTTEHAVEAEICTIDRCTRAVSIPDTLRIVGVETDKDVTRREFKVQCAYRGTDLSSFEIRIHFRNANKETDAYIVTDAQKDGDCLVFSWLMSRKALKYKGKLQFAVCFVNNSSDPVDEKEWNSTLGEFQVLEGLEVELTDEEEEEARDVLAQLLGELYARENEALLTIEAKGEEVKKTIEETGAASCAAIDDRTANSLASIPEDYTDLYNRAVRNTKMKADAIVDVSAKAASHALHIQPESGIHAVLHGNTAQEGSGDPTPENVRPITGLSKVGIRTGGKNLFSRSFGTERNSSGVKVAHGADDTIHISVSDNRSLFFTATYSFPIYLPAGTYTLSANNDKTAGFEGMSVSILMWCRQINKTYTDPIYLNKTNAKVVFTAKEPIMSLILRVGENAPAVEDFVIKPQLEFGGSASPFEPYNAVIKEIPIEGGQLHGDGEINDTVENDVVIDGERRSRITRRWGVIDSYAGEEITTDYISSTGGLDPGAQVVYRLPQALVTIGDAYPLEGVGLKPETVAGSGETEVTYAHDTKHYIDEKFAALSAALIGG